MKIEITDQEKEILISTIRSWEYGVMNGKIGKHFRTIQISLLKKLGANPDDIITHDDRMKEQFPLSYPRD